MDLLSLPDNFTFDQPSIEGLPGYTPLPDGTPPDSGIFPPDIEKPGLGLPSEIVCLEPECLIELDTYETVIETYLRATARFEVAFWYGLTENNGELWMPELMLRLVPGSGTTWDDQIDDVFDNGVTVTVTQAAPPFINNQSLNDLLADLVRVDSRALVDASTLEFAWPEPQGAGTLRTVFPPAGLTIVLRISGAEEALLRDLGIFETIPVDSTGMFMIQGDYSFLPIQIRENLSQHIPVSIVIGGSTLP